MVCEMQMECLGNRVEKANGTLYWNGPGGEVLDETNLTGSLTSEYVFFAGKRFGMRNVSSGTIYYYEVDVLDSSREERGLPGRRLVEPEGSVRRDASGNLYYYAEDFIGSSRAKRGPQVDG